MRCRTSSPMSRPGVRYEFHVRALSAAGPSLPSASASVAIVAGLPPFPEAPGNFTAVLTLDSEVFLSWTAPPSSADRSPVTGYEVYRQLRGGTARKLATTTVDALSYVFADVEPGVRYEFHVRALSAAGPSLPSASASGRDRGGDCLRFPRPQETSRQDSWRPRACQEMKPCCSGWPPRRRRIARR